MKALLLMAALAATGCAQSTAAPSAPLAAAFSATSVITDSVSQNACIVAALPQARRDVNVGTATLDPDGTLTTIERCPVCSTPEVMTWKGVASATVMDLPTTTPHDYHGTGCHVIEHTTSMTLHLTRTPTGWTGTRTNLYVLLDDTTMAPTGDTVVDTLAVQLLQGGAR